MFTLSLLTSRGVRVFFETPDVSKGVPEIVNSGRRDVIKKGLSGLLVVATATTAIGVLAGELDQNVGQVVNTVFGPLSFAQIQKHPQRAEILKGMRKENRDLKVQFDEWETQVVIDENKKKLDTQQVVIDEGRKIDANTQVVIKEGVELDQKLLATLGDIVRIGKTIETKYQPLVIKYATTPPPDKNALYIQAEAKKRLVFA